MTVLTADRLIRLAYKHPSLQNTWYLVACACLTVINRPNEIPKVFHFALRQQLLESSARHDVGLLTDKYLLKLAQDSISSSEKYKELTDVGVNLPDILIPYTYHDKLPFEYKYSRNEDIHATQSNVASKVREVILKCAALAGLPKTINALMLMKNVTPTNLRPSDKPERPLIVTGGCVRSSDLVGEDANGTHFESDENQGHGTRDTIDGPISRESIHTSQLVDNLVRGSDFWNTIYTNKINTRIKRQMITAYPDLWYFAYHNIYSPLLSYTDILSAKETSMCVVASLIPQDVIPQLKGHVKGALNIGVSHEEIEAIKQIVFDLCAWSGDVSWNGIKAKTIKL